MFNGTSVLYIGCVVPKGWRVKNEWSYAYSAPICLQDVCGGQLYLFSNSSASQEIPCILWRLKIRYRVNNSPRLVPILSHMNPLVTVPSYFCMRRLITSLPFALRYLKWSFRFCDLDLACTLYFTVRAVCTVCLLYDLTTAGTYFAVNRSWNSLPRSSDIDSFAWCILYVVLLVSGALFFRLPVASELASSHCLSLLEVQ